MIFIVTSSLPFKLVLAAIVTLLAAGLLARLDQEPNYLYLLKVLRHFSYKRHYKRIFSDEDLAKIKAEGLETAGLDALFREDGEAPAEETKAERKARLKAEKAERKADDKILKSKTATEEEKDAIWLKRANQSAAKKKSRKATKAGKQTEYDVADIIGFTDVKDGFIEYAGKYYGIAIEISPVEFRFFSEMRRANSIENGVGRILRVLPSEYAANIVKVERPVLYDEYLKNEYRKLDDLKKSYEEGLLSEEEMKGRVEILYDRIYELRDICFDNKVIQPFYYIVLFDSDKHQLTNSAKAAVDTLQNAEIRARILNDDKDIAIFLKYTNQLDFNERDIEEINPEHYAMWAMPASVDIKPRTAVINGIYTHNMNLINYPTIVGDAWMATVMTMPSTKVVVKCTPMDKGKAIRGIDNSLTELRGQYSGTGVDSKRMELAEHIQSLERLLAMLQSDSESLLNVNIYVTSYDINMTREDTSMPQPPRSNRRNIANMKRVVRRTYQEQGFRVSNQEFNQMTAFIGSQVSAFDPLAKKGRGIPSNSLAAAYPWVFAHVSDANGIKLGAEDGTPVFIDFFRRDSERVNSNMVIVGKSGSGKSYATKSLLANLAADDAKIFILDPENEYTELARSLNGKFINVGNATQGRLNPFHIITALDDDDEDGAGVSGSYATHLQFLEEFFRQILPDCERDALEYLNALVDRMYTNMGITAETNLAQLRPEDYPTFDDLYDAILMEFQSTDNDYIHTMLRTLMNYISKFSTDGRNANIWNGPSTVTTEENFTVFNFQSLLANRNGTIANAQMLLVLKYIDNEIIKNRDYNIKYGMNRKIVVVIDEAHVFIDTKFPIALDFMFQLAKRIRKYNGMQIVITQNIKDFVGSEEIARKSTAIINACQYSFIFSLAPNDMDDLCKLYEKAGGINESEREQIIGAARGQAFTIMSPQSRSSFKVEVPEDVVHMFQDQEYVSRYFTGPEGEASWEEFMGESREKRAELEAVHSSEEAQVYVAPRKKIVFEELSEDEFAAIELKPKKPSKFYAELEEAKAAAKPEPAELPEIADDFDEFDIPEDPEEFRRMAEAKAEKPEAPAEAPAPAPVIAEAPAPQPVVQTIQQTVVQSSKTEEMLGELLGRFSYESMLSEIRRSVREEVERELAHAKSAATAAVAAGGAVLGSIFNDEAMEEAGRIAAEEAIAKAEETAAPAMETAPAPEAPAEEAPAPADDEPADSGFDIMALLTAEAEKLGNISPIDLMETYGDTIISITLEDLVAYNTNHKAS
ncbi:MAG: DUF87 domain-containing protein [Clostridia bacterium]|nr:DUF87 domain-containing protein [Clostridia bacterium]